MPYHYTDPTREPRLCQGCKATGHYTLWTRNGPRVRECQRCHAIGILGDPHALPNVEVFYKSDCKLCDDSEAFESATEDYCERGWYYAYGFPGCLWDGEPMGPYDTEEEALKAAREF